MTDDEVLKALRLYLGDWCGDAASTPDEEDQRVLVELEDSLMRLRSIPFFEPLLMISRELSTPLEALGIWDAVEKVARLSANLASREARRQGETWEHIGKAVLVTKAAALQRYDPAARKRVRDRIASSRRMNAEEGTS